MYRIKKHSFLFFLLAFYILSHSAWCGVRTWEGTLTIPTYPWKEDTNPKFFALENSIIYPYTMQDNISTKKEERVYKAVFLENEYLKVTCLPELAGRIYSVLDKTTGEEMFHKNSVVKPGMIAMRGAWISGGIEWNTGPHGHSVTIVDPANVTNRVNRDGSATLVISNTEQIFRTRWTVFLTIHPGKTYLDERIAIANPTDFVHPYYFWNCTTFFCLPGTRFIYPMTLGTDHNGTTFFSWPIHEGKDLTWLKNYDEPTSVFAHDCVFDFFGAYDTGLDRGIVQYANHYELIGKKAWTWGQSDDGLVSQRNLHEQDEQYIEVQSGPLRTQADYGLLKPREIIQWREWWYPVHGLGDGFEYANRDLAVQRHNNLGRQEFRLLPTGIFKRARITLQNRHTTLLDLTADLSPLEPTVVFVHGSEDDSIILTVTQRDGSMVTSYESPLPIPLQTPSEPDWKAKKSESELSVEEIYLKGLLSDKQTDRIQARQWYEKALAKDSHHTPSLKALAVLDLEAGLFEEAISRLEKAVERDSDDGMLWFYLGSAYFHSNLLENAKRCAFKSIHTIATASLGYDLAGRVCMRTGQYPKAVEMFENAARKNPDDSRAINHLAIAQYASGNFKAAKSLANERAQIDPTDPIPSSIFALMKKGGMASWIANRQDCLGDFDFEIIEASSIFSELGLFEEASRIIRSAFVEKIGSDATNPLPFYYLAELAGRLDDMESVYEYLQQAESLPGDGIFPSRLEMIPVLQFAIKTASSKNQPSSRACLHLGNLFAGLGRLEEALEYWKQAVARDATLSAAWRNLGLYAWKKQNDLATAAVHYQTAIQNRPGDQTLYRDLAQILIAHGKRREAIQLLNPIVQRDDPRTDLIEILAEAFVNEKEYTQAIDLLERSFFSNWENRVVSRNVFVHAHIARGKHYLENGELQKALDDFSDALTYPDNLGVGRPARPSESEAYYWKGKALEAMNRLPEAREAWKQGAQYSPAEYRKRCEKAIQDVPQ